jgi:hypothetical protein
MPTLDLIVSPPDVCGLPVDGNLLLDHPVAGLNRVLLRRLNCWLRMPPIPGTYGAVVDTGAPLSVFPHKLWSHQFHWHPGRDFEEISTAGVGSALRSQVLGHRYSCRLALLRVPVEPAGLNLKSPRLRVNSLICLLAEPGGSPAINLGLWGGVFEGRRLQVQRQPNSDDLAAQLEW